MKIAAFFPQKILAWLIATLLLLVAIVISAMPSIFVFFMPFQYIHLIVLMIILMLSAGSVPLWLLLVTGIIVDTFHQQPLGSSSLLFLFILPFVQLFCQSAVRFSLPQIWGVFCGFFCIYILGQLLIQTLFLESKPAYFPLMINSLWSIFFFPIIFATVLYIFGQRHHTAMTPL